MVTVATEIDRYLTLLRNKIRQRGFTQLQVQEALGWGRSYISQLLTKQKALRIEQVLLILGVIDVEPIEFFGEMYAMRAHCSPGYPSPKVEAMAELQREVQGLRTLVHGLADLLLRERLISNEDLSAAVESVRCEPGAGDDVIKSPG